MKAIIRLSGSIMILLFCCTMIGHTHNGKTAYAIPISGISIDGKLDDWPWIRLESKRIPVSVVWKIPGKATLAAIVNS